MSAFGFLWLWVSHQPAEAGGEGVLLAALAAHTQHAGARPQSCSAFLVTYQEQAREPTEQCQSHPAGGEPLVASDRMK